MFIVLQPSRPATAIDATFLFRSSLGAGPDGELQSTYSYVSGGRYTSVFGAVLASDYNISLLDVGYGPSDTAVVIEANTTREYTVLGATSVFTVSKCDKWDFQLYSIAPILPNGEWRMKKEGQEEGGNDVDWLLVRWRVLYCNGFTWLVCGSGWAVIGETAKWVPVNNARITDVSYDSSSVTVTAAGVHGETVSVGRAGGP